MNILIVHQNFPGQFKHLAPALVKLGHRVVAMTLQKVQGSTWNGVELVSYSVSRGSTPNIHPWVSDFETKIIRADACFRAALKLKAQGFSPDCIVAHPGWGESLFLKQVWSQAKLGIYCEFSYSAHGADVGFDPEFPAPDPAGDHCRLQLKNTNNLLHFETADAGISPTQWQASTFAQPFRSKIKVVHDGIDTDAIAPNAQVSLTLNGPTGAIVLTKDSEVVTFVNRNLEPYRGYHIFMRALPDLLKRRPNAHILLVGAEGVSYGARPDANKYGGQSWKAIFSTEVRPQISDADWARVHFLGHVAYAHFVALLQLSTVHVYLTYPFVLSWSLLEAMSAGCAIVASDTQPLKEAIHHDQTGLLVDFFDVAGLTTQVCRLLDDPATRARLSHNARLFAQANYDLKSVCLPKQLQWVESLMDKP